MFPLHGPTMPAKHPVALCYQLDPYSTTLGKEVLEASRENPGDFHGASKETFWRLLRSRDAYGLVL